jgi:hypothetical protein
LIGRSPLVHFLFVTPWLREKPLFGTSTTGSRTFVSPRARILVTRHASVGDVLIMDDTIAPRVLDSVARFGVNR